MHILYAEGKNDLLSLYQNLANVDQCETAENNEFSSFLNYRFSCNLPERQKVKHLSPAHPLHSLFAAALLQGCEEET